MKGILADNNARGHVGVLVRILQTSWRQEVWASLQASVFAFSDFALTQEVADSTLWQTCQAQEVVLITQNRNARGPDSLEATIRSQNTSTSLPVLTLGNGERILNDRDYAERVAERLLEYLLDIEKYHGAGRLFLP